MEIRTREAHAQVGKEASVWLLGYVTTAQDDAKKFLTPEQYAHAVRQFDELAAEQNPRKSLTQDVRPIDEFYELREKGGILGRINLRAYFAVFDEARLILVLGCYKKEDDGQTPPFIKIKMRNRLRFAKTIILKKESKGSK